MDNDSLDAYRRQLLERYRGQVAQYRSHFSALNDTSVRAPIKPGEWSAHRLLFHVLAVDEQAYGPRLERILHETRPALDDFDEASWMAERYEPDEPPLQILDAWAALRQRLADLLADVPSQAWNRTGLQPYWGERTLQWWLERAVTHADDHWGQLQGE